MAGKGVQSFVHNHASRPTTNPRRAPQKLVADEAALNGQRYASVEPSDRASSHGAFSTDLGSYPDTSTNDTREQFVLTGDEQEFNASRQHNLNAIATKTSTKTRSETDITIFKGRVEMLDSKAIVKSDMPPPQKKKNIISISHPPGDTQNPENYSVDQDHDLRDIVARSSANRPQKTSSNHVQRPTSQQGNSGHRSRTHTSMALQTSAQGSHIIRNQMIEQNEINQVPSNGFAHQTRRDNRFGRVPTRAPAGNIWEQQASPQVQRTFRTEIPDSQDVIPIQIKRTASMDLGLEPARLSSSPEVVNSTPERTSIRDRWPLKRKASLSTVQLDLNERELLQTPYAALDEDEESNESPGSPSNAEINDWIINIKSHDFDEVAAFTRITQLSNRKWTDLGHKLSTENSKAINDLKNLRNRKREIAKRYEDEVRETMKQIETNDKVVSGRLQELRAYGTRMLGNDVAVRSREE